MFSEPDPAYIYLVLIVSGITLLLAVLALPANRNWTWFWSVFSIPWAAEAFKLGEVGITLTLPTDLIAGVIGLAGLVYLSFRLDKIALLWQSRIFRWSVFLFLWMGIVAVLFSENKLVSIKFWLSQGAYWVTFGLGASLWVSEQRMQEPLWFYRWAVLPAAFIVLAICVGRHLALGGVKEAIDKVLSPFMREHTVYGAYAAWFFIASFLLLLYKPSILGGAILIVSGSALLLSYSRGAWLSGIGALGLYGLIYLYRWLPPIVRLIGVGALSVSTLFAMLLFFDYNPNMLELYAYQSGGEVGKHLASSFDLRRNVSNLERINRWFAALQMIEERPWVGFGPNTFMEEYSAYQRSFTRTIISVELGEVGGAHSEYLTAASEMGIPGLLLLLGVYLSTLFVGLRGFIYAPTLERRFTYALLLFPLLSYYLHGIINNFMDHGHMAALVYLHWGILTKLDQKISNTSDATSS
ncbi:MAG: O-antigen ligase family protein [Bacteroidia bacterium]|nr:O-antigen ligase family protein [Bacteroidia bacterium]MDW8134444.1 O-antigen ligase family protein [Bacteroidia bacterium]